MFETLLGTVRSMVLFPAGVEAMKRMIKRRFEEGRLSLAEAVTLLDTLQHRIDTATIPVSIPA